MSYHHIVAEVGIFEMLRRDIYKKVHHLFKEQSVLKKVVEHLYRFGVLFLSPVLMSGRMAIRWKFIVEDLEIRDAQRRQEVSVCVDLEIGALGVL